MPSRSALARRTARLRLCAGAALGFLATTGAALAARQAPPRDADAFSRARPILAARCFSCHGPNQKQGGLRLDRAAEALRGGDSGPAIRPGKSGESLLIRYVTGADPKKVMPPTGPRLTPAEARALREWIDAGAPWPGEAAAGDKSAHWAFQAPRRPPLPRVRQAAWGRGPVDAFILARLEREGLRPAPEADRATLLRRVSLDLIGLPPTPAEVDAFLADGSPEAYERVVDRLLASPHFGERWGRHWLDLARYADSDGYEKDLPRPYAYLYRDWVIEALNRDLPFDQFTVEQMAGDLLPDASPAQKIATGFHRNTLKNREGGVDQEEDRNKIAVDRTNTTGTVWLGLTVGCAECHSHKYDPISQHEYFGLFAFFNSVSDVDLPVPTPAEQEAYDRARAAWQTERARLQAALDAAGPADRKAREAALAAHQKAQPAAPATKAQITIETDPPPPTHVHLRGDFLRKGERVEPHVPAVLPALGVPAGRRPNRLDLARWLVDPANPLTARVTVNRVWQHLFGRGLVGTPSDWGTRGEPPTHPELLDWLAVEFRAPSAPGARPWSLKGLIRLIATSATYRQSSAARPELRERDPRNLLLARQNRIRPEAEIMRDLVLAASGLLHREIGGPSIRPPLPADIAALGYANSVKWTETTGPARYKRGMYIFFQRTVPYPLLATFDAPDSNTTCTRRERSNTPLQALTLLNDPAFIEGAQALGRRLVLEGGPDPAQRVHFGFRVCLSRAPTSTELERLTLFQAEMEALCRRQPESALKLAGGAPPAGVDAAALASWVAVARTLLNLDEFLTRE
jgi:mono/diheme cytochrome c family protein